MLTHAIVNAQAAGKYRQEGKNYTVNDGDVRSATSLVTKPVTLLCATTHSLCTFRVFAGDFLQVQRHVDGEEVMRSRRQSSPDAVRRGLDLTVRTEALSLDCIAGHVRGPSVQRRCADVRVSVNIISVLACWSK